MTAKTALVVDDSKSARFAMRRFLENLGYQVDTAESAEDAFSYLQNKRPEVMFLDHIMPGTDGFGAIRAIRQNAQTAQLPIVLCSSNEGEEFLRQARACGAVDVLGKPPGAEQIKAVLDNLWRQQEAAGADAAATPPPAPAAATSAPPARPGPAPLRPIAAEAAPAAPREDIGPRLDSLREHIEARMRKVTQDFFAQVGELKAQVTNLEASQVPQDDTARLQAMANAAAEQRVAVLAQDLDRQLSKLHGEVEEMLQAQYRRIEQLGDSLRRALAEESQAAGARIAEQLADALVRGLKPE